MRLCIDLQNQWSRRVIVTLMELYLDLPSLGYPSANALILRWALQSATVYHCIAAVEAHYAIPNINGYNMEMLAPWPIAPNFKTVMGRLVPMYLHPSGTLFESEVISDPTNPLTAKVDWSGIDTNLLVFAIQMREMLLKPHSFYYGTGLSRLHSPTSPSAGGVWDWATAEGEWCLPNFKTPVRTVVPNAVDGAEAVDWSRETTFNFPSTFSLKVSSGVEDINRAFKGASSDSVPISCLWDHFPNVGTQNAPPHPRFPPLFFHNGDTQHSEDAFVYGFVCLSLDSPPELIWTMAWQSRTVKHRGALFQGVQIGGCGSRLGIIGVGLT